MKSERSIYLLKGLPLAFALFVAGSPSSHAVECARATANEAVPPEIVYQIQHIHFEEDESQLFLLTATGKVVGEIRYRAPEDGERLYVVDVAIDPDHHDPNLKNELFAVLARLRPWATVFSSEEEP